MKSVLFLLVGTWYFTSAHNCDTILNINHLSRTRSVAFLPYKIVLEDLIQPPSVKSFYHQGFFAVKRRAVFILGATWNALVRGWRRDCVVGGMETRFQWRKAHSRTAKCEAFHVAPRLFFMFLFLIPFTIRQLCVIYPQEFSTEPWISLGFALLWFFCTDLRIFFDNCYWKIFFISKFAPQKW